MSVIIRVAAMAVCVVVSLPDREARACRKGTVLLSVLPTKGATDVPTNTRIWATYKAVGVKKPKLRLLDAKGRVVKARLEHHDQGTINALAMQVMSLTPGGALSAKARYTSTMCGLQRPTRSDWPGGSNCWALRMRNSGIFYMQRR